MKKALRTVFGVMAAIAALTSFGPVQAGADQWDVIRCNTDGTYDCRPGCPSGFCCGGSQM